MRIKRDQIEFIKQTVLSVLPEASVFLFGSRVHEDSKGGDIDILVVGKRRLTNQEVRTVKIEFYKKFGEQKVDIVSFKSDERSAFKELAALEAIQV